MITKRQFDVVFSLSALLVFALPMLMIALAIRLTSKGPAIYWSDRVGKNNRIFHMPKFRTMYIDTPAVATHLLPAPESCVTPLGGLLRKTSLDELPQLWSILAGDMSLVGPRPALYNQDDLIEQRTQRGLDCLVPGLTGWAQVNGRDDLSIAEKVALDAEYMQRKSIWFDLKVVFLTVFSVMRSRDVSH